MTTAPSPAWSGTTSTPSAPAWRPSGRRSRARPTTSARRCGQRWRPRPKGCTRRAWRECATRAATPRPGFAPCIALPARRGLRTGPSGVRCREAPAGPPAGLAAGPHCRSIPPPPPTLCRPMTVHAVLCRDPSVCPEPLSPMPLPCPRCQTPPAPNQPMIPPSWHLCCPSTRRAPAPGIGGRPHVCMAPNPLTPAAPWQARDARPARARASAGGPPPPAHLSSLVLPRPQPGAPGPRPPAAPNGWLPASQPPKSKARATCMRLPACLPARLRARPQAPVTWGHPICTAQASPHGRRRQPGRAAVKHARSHKPPGRPRAFFLFFTPESALPPSPTTALPSTNHSFPSFAAVRGRAAPACPASTAAPPLRRGDVSPCNVAGA
jgi:hypothetical protein